jgi:hypothetical protein
MLGFIVLAVVVVAAFVAYKLWKSGKAVTGAAVVAGVEADAKVLAEKAAAAAANTVVSKL